jgi:hypothetical protein
MRHDHVQCVSGAALEETDQNLAFRRIHELRAKRSATEEARAQAHGYECQRA